MTNNQPVQGNNEVDLARSSISSLAVTTNARNLLAVDAYAKLMEVRDVVRNLARVGRYGFNTLNAAQRVELFKSPEFAAWVQAEKACGRVVVWLSDLDKAMAAGDTFTFFFDYRRRHNSFNQLQNQELISKLLTLNFLTEAERGEIKTNSPTENASLVLKLWKRQEFDKLHGIDLLSFWNNFYWPSNLGISRQERQQLIASFASEYPDRIFPGVVEENRALSESGVIPVIVSNGDIEIAQAVAPLLAIKPDNVAAVESYYTTKGIHTGAGHSLEIFDPQWSNRPQSGKLIRFNCWAAAHFPRKEIVIAGFDGDSPAADGGAMLTLRPRVGFFIIDTPGEHDLGRLGKFRAFVDKHGQMYAGHFYAVRYDEPIKGPRP